MSRLRSSKSFAILLSALVLITLACGASGGGPSAPLGAGTPAPSEPETITQERDVIYGPGPFDLPDAKVGLSDLTSYQSTLTLSFDGTRDGQPEAWTRTYVISTQTDPLADPAQGGGAARQLTIESSGDLPDLEPVFLAETAGTSYVRFGENACEAAQIDPANTLSERLEPAGFLNYVLGADEAGTETINAVQTIHYTFDQRALGQEELAESTGEMWVASEAGYVVKYVLSTTANADYFGEGIEGTLSYDYELTQINQPVEITLPEDCPPGMVEAPQMSDATDVVNMPGVLSYETGSTLQDVVAFYQQKLPEIGWAALGEPSITDTSALLAFTKEDQALTVNITAENGVTSVLIGLSRFQE